MLLPTTLLHHAGSTRGPHHDWLIVDPTTRGRRDAPLWTARVAAPWRDWRALGRFTLTALPPHRRRYLSWQGALTAGRGHVRRVATSHLEPHLWTPRRLVLTLHPPSAPPHRDPDTACPLTLQLDRRDSHWHATVLPDA